MVQAAADSKLAAVADNEAIDHITLETAENDHDHGIKQPETKSGPLLAKLILCGVFMACSSLLIILNKVPGRASQPDRWHWADTLLSSSRRSSSLI
jgi:hypothetical protein